MGVERVVGSDGGVNVEGRGGTAAFPTRNQVRGVLCPLRTVAVLLSFLYLHPLLCSSAPSSTTQLSLRLSLLSSLLTQLSLFLFSVFVFDLRPWRYLPTRRHSPT